MKKVFFVLVGSLLSVMFGSLVCAFLWMLVALGVALATWEFEGILGAVWFGLIALLYGGALSLVAWATVFVWVYAFVPRTSRLWHWPICMACGAGAGFLLAAVFVALMELTNPWIIFAAGCSGFVTGAAACWFTAVTAGRFRPQ
jgi:uncharacterized BrkB/YihY/UPF0761 family membrane protein